MVDQKDLVRRRLGCLSHEALLSQAVNSSFDSLCQRLLTRKAFTGLYLQEFAPNPLRLFAPNVPLSVVRQQLWSVTVSSEGKVHLYLDVAYLKAINDLSPALGDLLLLITSYLLSKYGFILCSRRGGDEMEAIHPGPFEEVMTICRQMQADLARNWPTILLLEEAGELAGNAPALELCVKIKQAKAKLDDGSIEEADMPVLQVEPGLPAQFDFGVTRESEAAQVFCDLLDAGWVPKEGREPVKVFYDILLVMSETRQKVAKLHYRALVLYSRYALYTHLGVEGYTEQEYQLFADTVTRGSQDSYVFPEADWYMRPVLEEYVLMLVLAKFPHENDQFREAVRQAALSIYKRPQ